MEAKETAAWNVIEQMLKHIWGPDKDLDDKEVLSVCKMFWRAGGKWKEVMDGDPEHFSILEECIGNVISAQKLTKIAMNVLSKVRHV